MSILRWDPMEDFYALRREMARMVDDVMPPRLARMVGTTRPMRLPLDAYATEDEIVILASVPGMKPEDVEITLEGDTLTISGQLRAPLENVEYLFQERPYGQFSRSLTINVPIDVEQAEARFENGILTLILPKAQEAKPKVIKINTRSEN